ncbi:PIG-L deacetylase family protein [Pantanalinema rosaneae CENA516]|uniref:PIG-L deacetylase family protein n=1 Tax=Pantanalinema rosaneae TaxID=1620701 RepID=UPI003D700834
MLKHWLRKWHQARIARLSRSFQWDDLKRSAIVFSPHQDDETLGCGGTIVQKQQAGAAIKIVFMTDGSGSHSGLMPPQTLAELRQQEAIAAAEQLGLPEQDVIFLGLPDGELSSHQSTAIQKVTDLLYQYQPEEVYIPYYLEPHPDHVATNTAVIGALQEYRQAVMVCEYPVWFWSYWPWVNFSGKIWDLKLLKWLLKVNLKLMRDFQRSIAIADILDQKRQALEQHESQLKPLVPDPNWTTLQDVSDGMFLECFFQNYEIFHCYRFPN